MEQNKLTNEEVRQVLCPYMVSKCEWVMSYRNKNNSDILCWNEPLGMNFHDIARYIGREDWIKPVLISLQDITDEDAVVLSKMARPNWEIDSSTTLDIKIMLKSDGIDISSECFQYLVQKGYAVHLFFGVNHWANGKTAIELGIAINKNQK